MKYKLYLDFEACLALDEWGRQNTRYVLDAPSLADSYELVFKFETQRIMYATVKRSGYSFSIKQNGIAVLNGSIMRTTNGEHDHMIKMRPAQHAVLDLQNLDFQKNIKLMCKTFLQCVSFLLYNNVVGDKEYVAAGRNVGSVKVITFRKSQEKLYAVKTSAHRSPDGVFSVRGHFRHYKDGKIVWIDEYFKGKEK